MNFKKSLKLALMDREKTQDWLAGRLGVTKATVSSYVSKTGRPRGETIEKVCKALDMKVSECIALGED